MADLIETIAKYGFPVVPIIVGLYFGKQLIEYFWNEILEVKKAELNQNLENYKGQLEQQNKNFQHGLDRKLNEFNIRFSKLHQDRAEVTKELYKKMVVLHTTMLDYANSGRIDEEAGDFIREGMKWVRAGSSFSDVNAYFETNKIYFKKELASKISVLLFDYKKKKGEVSMIQQHLEEDGISYALISSKETVFMSIANDLGIILEELEDEFRSILGVD